LNRVNLTPQEVAALLQGLSRGEADLGAEPEAAPALEAPRPPGNLGPWDRRCGQDFPKISHWWVAVTKLPWTQFPRRRGGGEEDIIAAD
jgi:hypothetical protein